jgi:nucleoside-triphosphatase THEP1
MSLRSAAKSGYNATAMYGYRGGAVDLAEMASAVEVLPPMSRYRRKTHLPWLGVQGVEVAAAVPPATEGASTSAVDVAETGAAPASGLAGAAVSDSRGDDEDEDHGLGALLTSREAAAYAAAAARAEAAREEEALPMPSPAPSDDADIPMSSPADDTAGDDVGAAEATARSGGESFVADVPAAAGNRAGAVGAESAAPSPPDAASKVKEEPPDALKDEVKEEPVDTTAAFLAEAAAFKRQHIFITSPPGVGKTTMVQRLLKQLRDDVGEVLDMSGFYTEELRKGPERTGFDLVKVGGTGRQEDGPHRDALARLGQDQPKVGKYTVDVASFERFGLPLLAPLKRGPALPENPCLYTARDGSIEVVELTREAMVPKLEDLDEDDPPPPVKVRQTKGPTFIEAEKWEGAKPGYFFTKGVEGLGYYLDRPFGSWMPDDGPKSSSEEENEEKEYCLIYIPSTGEQAWVDPSDVQVLEEGWKHPLDQAAEARKLRPRLIVCDEAGKMELLSLKFPHTLFESLNDEGHVFLGTFPQAAKGQRDHEVIDKIRKRQDVWQMRITRNNRDSVLPQVYAQLRESLGLGPPGTKQERLKTEWEADLEKKNKEQALKEEAARKAQRKHDKAKSKASAELDKVKVKNAKKKREDRKRRADIRSRYQALRQAAKNGPLEVEEEDEVQALAQEVELEDDSSSAGAIEDDGYAVVEDIDAVLDVESSKPKPAVVKPVSAGRVRRIIPKAKAVVVPNLSLLNGRRRPNATGPGAILLDEQEVLLDDAEDEVL